MGVRSRIFYTTVSTSYTLHDVVFFCTYRISKSSPISEKLAKRTSRRSLFDKSLQVEGKIIIIHAYYDRYILR